jgi:hypothetical protein
VAGEASLSGYQTEARKESQFCLFARGLLEPNTEEMKTVKRVLARKPGGKSYQKIAARLNEQGVVSKNGGKWHPKTVIPDDSRVEVAADARRPPEADGLSTANALQHSRCGEIGSPIGLWGW